ncbi:MAG: FecR family protein [Pseudobacter sp.]|uniref:FecR family protein n=1 Tax=Pseudobacter sp. TaxID=2045420 RepID=UPI003F7D0DF4
MEKASIIYLLKRQAEGSINDKELDVLEGLLTNQETADIVNDLLETESEYPEPVPEMQTRQLFRKIMESDSPGVMPGLLRSISTKWKWVAAAILLLTVAGAGWWMLRPTSSPIAIFQQNPVLPGTDKATLTRADGTVISLDSIQQQQFNQGSSNVTQRSGELEYTPSNVKTEEIWWNKLTVPRGGQFRLKLADGTKVWLNASSSIEYPVSFVGERKVRITGEAYFEIAANANHPFIVSVNDHTDVLVLGTQFNINAYTDEPAIRTTLLQGAVQVRSDKNKKELQPGETVSITTSGAFVLEKNVNTEQAVAWKNGLFNFNKADLQTVMKQLARWYDIDIVYAGDIPKRRFGGELQRKLNLSDVLEFLKESGLKFKLENRTLTIFP